MTWSRKKLEINSLHSTLCRSVTFIKFVQGGIFKLIFTVSVQLLILFLDIVFKSKSRVVVLVTG